MTAVEGLISGGMEYPMMTLIGGARTDASLFGVTYHEVAHMWFPMLVGSDEKSFVWLDEGLTEFNESVGKTDFLSVDGFSSARAFYYSIARSDIEVEAMRHGDLFPSTGGVRHVATYQKPALILRSLVSMYGAERFYGALSEYARRWTYKHPQPYDFFNTFEDVLGEDLDWLWSPAFFDTWKSDVAIGSVSRGEDGSTEVVVEDRGLLPMPVVVAATFEGGDQQVQIIPVDAWLSGSVKVRVIFSGDGLSRVELDPDMLLLDIDRSNNTWEMDE
jgi:aminopeptidase N